MRQIVKKGMAALVGVALVSAAGLAQAETRFAVQDSSLTPKDKMVVTDKGYIGIGTNNPATALQVKGNGYDSTQILSHYVGNDNWAAGGFIAYRNNLAPDGVTVTLPKKGNRVGYFMFGSQVASPTGYLALNGAGLSGYAEADWTATSTPTDFRFDLAPSGSMARIERMRITSTGNVGIGTTAPTQKLEVNGAIRLTNTAARPAASSALRGVIWMTEGGDGTADTLAVCVKDANGNYAWIVLN